MGDQSLTYRDLDKQSDQLASALQARGVRQGARVALLLRNSIEFCIADVAIAKLGACKVPLNDMLSPVEVAYAIEHSGAAALIAQSSFAPIIAQAGDIVQKLDVRIAVSVDGVELPGFLDLKAVMEGAQYPWTAPSRVGPETPGLIIYTGGTTGKPKGVVHTHEALATNLLAQALMGEISGDERMLLCTPLPHSGQLFAQAGFIRGAEVHLHERFVPEAVIEAITSQHLTWLFLVPTMIYRLLDSPRRDEMAAASLRTIVYGASPIAKARLQEAIDVFGTVFLQIYGQTEAPNFITTLSKSDHLIEEFQTSCGQPSILCDVCIRDNQGHELEPGEVGHITVRSAYTLENYHREPEKTNESYIDDWLVTGDLGYQSRTGHVYLVDRAKDMIISGGMNVYSVEVENVLSKFPGVRQAMVIGVPDSDWGEAVHAFVLADEGTCDESALREHCRASLAKYKVPKRIEFVQSVPLTAYGKPDKKALRSKFWGDTTRQIH